MKKIKKTQSAQVIDDAISWDLSDLYKNINDKQITTDLNNINKKTIEFNNKYYNQIKKLDGEKLYQAIKNYEEISEQIALVQTYSYLVYSSDLANQKNIAFYQNISEKISNFETKLIFFCLEINELDAQKIKKMLANSPLKKYQAFIRDTRFFKDHQLSQELEKFIVEKNITSRNAFIRLFDETINNLKFPYQNQQLNSQQIFDLMSNKDQKIRQRSASSIAKVFKDNIKLFAFITNILAKDKAIEDNYRNFKNPISARNLSNFIEDEVVETLIKTTQNNYAKTAHRYYKIKAKLLNKKFLNYWDRNADLEQIFDKKNNQNRFSFKQAQEIVIEAYDEFSPQMAKIAKQFFDKKWIDAKVRTGKDSGAYSHPCVPKIHPYILMNFQGKARDIMTLAHELGHGIHQYLAGQQGYLQCSTPLTLAETASVFGEQLTFQKLLQKEQNISRKKLIIANKIEDMINTAIRQIAFLEFETKIHNARKQQEIPVEEINKFWLEVQQKSLGKAFKFNDEYQYFWCYIPHFIHSPFYVYSYAFGECLVNSLYAVYKSQKITNFNDKYLEMLKLGGVNHYQEMLKPFNLDLKKESFWQAGLDVIIEYINQLEEIL